jgi:hypothetical protein
MRAMDVKRGRRKAMSESEMTRRAFLRLLGATALTVAVGTPTTVARGDAFRARAHGEVDIAASHRQRKCHG